MRSSRPCPDTRELLSIVSVCDPIPAELAGELSGRQDAARELNALHHDSGLITRGPLPSEYRVHVLLRSYLRAELARQRPTLIRQLNARAARWWAARDQPVEALRQAMNGVPPAVLTDLVRRFVLPLLLTGEHATLRRALSILGEAAAEDPLLAATQAALRTASIDGAGAVELQALRTVTGSVAGRRPSVPPDNRTRQVAWTALDAFVRGADLLRRQGEVRSGLQLLAVALDLARSHGFDYLAMQCEALMAAGAAALHDCDAMIKTSDQALAMADEHGWQRTPWATTAQALLAYGALLRAEPDEAYRLASQAFRGAPVLDRELEFGLRSLLGAAMFDRGQHAAGLQQMQHARADLGEHHVPPVQAAATATAGIPSRARRGASGGGTDRPALVERSGRAMRRDPADALMGGGARGTPDRGPPRPASAPGWGDAAAAVVIEPWLTDQWYVDAATLAKPAIEAVRSGEIRFVPKTWEKTWFNWMENIQPWCVSRQLWWGHRIPAWYDAAGNVYVAESEAEAQARGGAGRGAAPRSRRARHLVLLRALAVRYPGLARRRPRS